ncbi:DUF2294 domain-containing protein [Desulforamulus ruminis]|uniref:Na+-translocating membrane potential-generating system MpsC domain-containing protein n=1 Tax=Desulforamulus ruminis (strain ATCC 23193 / DSM 2154 / NCIMB 8452 / DL) TaxID=696281 RepID=F6DU46_DESRL|nr:DUF2294 domain-containing protein [Desulforamulus ruminis]AEG60121.1 Protein of unknown function DUF2294 [Desulforamulus ruminis DSM 2154]
MQSVMEKKICDEFIKFQKNLVGRGPECTRVMICRDMVIIRSSGVLTKEEKHVCGTPKGRSLVKQLRLELRDTYINQIESLIKSITFCKVNSSHGDISIRTGEHIEVFILDQDLEKRLQTGGMSQR